MSAGPPAARAWGHGGPVTAELETYARELSWIFDQVCESRGSCPPQELWGTGRPREIFRREALVESIRHAAIHLGELRLTRSLAVEPRSTGTRDARRGTKEKDR